MIDIRWSPASSHDEQVSHAGGHWKSVSRHESRPIQVKSAGLPVLRHEIISPKVQIFESVIANDVAEMMDGSLAREKLEVESHESRQDRLGQFSILCPPH